MNLVRYNPNYRLRTRTNKGAGVFDDLFSDFFSPFMMPTQPVLQESMNLKVDIFEKDNTIIINAELPGLNKEDISVDIKGKHVTLSGERKSDEEIKEEKSYRRERSYGKFERTFSLPFEVSDDKVTATYINGVLKLEIPRPEDQAAKRITIN